MPHGVRPEFDGVFFLFCASLLSSVSTAATTVGTSTVLSEGLPVGVEGRNGGRSYCYIPEVTLRVGIFKVWRKWL